MGYLSSVKRSKIFNEFDEEKRKEFFNITEKKVLHNIDTFYYSVFIKGDDSENENEDIETFIDLLEHCKQLCKNNKDTTVWFNYDENLLYKSNRFDFYNHCISFQGWFDVFISEYLPNKNTPRMIVQLRSKALWSCSTRDIIEMVNENIKKILSMFNLEIEKINENRIDYCFHTNSVQNFDKYFNDNYIRDYVDTQFKIGSKVFTKDKDCLNVTYLSLGNRSSNNLFFRTYNKTVEVCEMAYKDFFFDVWLENGLISKYDKYIYEFCYVHKSFNKRYVAMVEFYSRYGSNLEVVKRCKELLKSPHDDIERYRKLIKGICPEPIIIQNFEFQSMRKFYYNGKDLIDSLPILKECSPELLRIFQILDNRKIFIDYFLNKLVVFNSPNGSACDFWKRIQSCKIDYTVEIEYKRKYSNSNNDIKRAVRMIEHNLALYSVYSERVASDIYEDLGHFINRLNDNDVYAIDTYTKIKAKKEKAQKNINALKSFSSNNNKIVS